MTERERLIELITQKQQFGTIIHKNQMDDRVCKSIEITNAELADYLIENGVFVPHWISVEDRLSEEKVNCIVHYIHAYCDNDGYWAIGFCFYDGEKFQFEPAYKVTHWLPLPEPPKVEQKLKEMRGGTDA